jgi:transketolase C-terminal domain/subunit
MIRILLSCSTVELKNDEIELMRKTLIINGYPEHLINRGIREAEAITKRMISQ